MGVSFAIGLPISTCLPPRAARVIAGRAQEHRTRQGFLEHMCCVDQCGVGLLASGKGITTATNGRKKNRAAYKRKQRSSIRVSSSNFERRCHGTGLEISGCKAHDQPSRISWIICLPMLTKFKFMLQLMLFNLRGQAVVATHVRRRFVAKLYC